MTMNLLHGFVWLIVTGTLTAYMLRVRLPQRWIQAVTVGGISFFFVASLTTTFSSVLALDFISFQEFGRTILAGGDSTSFIANRRLPPLHPPTAYPLFVVLGVFDYQAGLTLWVALSVLMCLALVPFSRRTLLDRETPGVAALGGWGLSLVSTGFAVSNAPRSMLQSGQVAAAMALGLIGSLAAQSNGKPILAGLGLAVGTIKPNSALPFLMLFLRRRDLKTWLTLAVVCIGACFAFGWNREISQRASVYLKTISKHNQPGEVNDITFTGPQTAGMVGLDYAIYRLGFHQPKTVQLVLGAMLGGLGLWLLRRVVSRDGKLPDGGACSQVALYSTIFLYHRTHDFVVLALPLTYAVARARVESGRSRLAFTSAGIMILLSLSQQRKLIELLEGAVKSRTDLQARLAQAIVLPYATWLVLLAMLALALGERWSNRVAAPRNTIDPDR